MINKSGKKSYIDGVHDISNEDYHDANGVSRSQLMSLDKSPYHFWYENLSGLYAKDAATPSMIVGALFHTLLLEPHLFSKEFALIPSLDRRTSKGKEEYAQFLQFSGNKTVVTQEQFDKASKMAELVSKHEIVTTLLNDSVFEQSIFWTDFETGIQFKVRPDIWSSRMVVDVKTTKDAGVYSFTRSALQYGYYLQAGMIYEACKSIGKKFDMFVHLAIEKEEPYVPSVYIMDDDALQYGIDQFGSYKRKLKECFDKNIWPGYPVKELNVPKYATFEEN